MRFFSSLSKLWYSSHRFHSSQSRSAFRLCGPCFLRQRFEIFFTLSVFARFVNRDGHTQRESMV